MIEDNTIKKNTVKKTACLRDRFLHLASNLCPFVSNCFSLFPEATRLLYPQNLEFIVIKIYNLLSSKLKNFLHRNLNELFLSELFFFFPSSVFAMLIECVLTAL